MDRLVTVIIPVAPQHTDVYHRAIESAHRQTIPCDIVPYFDRQSRGAGYARNEGARDTVTPFIVFLDADDTLEPTFIADCLRAYEQGRYVYTAWYEGERVMRPRQCNPYLRHDFDDGRGDIGGYHLATTLIPTALFEAVGGFDVGLPGMEDTDLFLRFQSMGICGRYVDKPLVRYEWGGVDSRSQVFKRRPDYDTIVRSVYERNGGVITMAGCCGHQQPIAGQSPERLPGDVAVRTLYAPMSQFGRVTGRQYKRPLNMGDIIYVAPEDANAMPDLFQRVLLDASELTPTKDDVLKAAGIF